jgi:hypothetical protein
LLTAVTLQAEHLAILERSPVALMGHLERADTLAVILPMAVAPAKATRPRQAAAAAAALAVQETAGPHPPDYLEIRLAALVDHLMVERADMVATAAPKQALS